MQVKASSIGRILSNLEKKYHNTYDGGDMKKSPSGQQLKKRERIQMIPPFNANKVRNSPSTEPVSEVAAAVDAEPDAQVDEILKDVAESNEEQQP